MKTLGYNVLNEPDFIRTYHLHNTQIRNYTQKDRVINPYGMIIPKKNLNNQINFNSSFFNEKLNIYNGNLIVKKYIFDKMEKNENFVIPRFSTVETNYAVFSKLLETTKINERNQLLSYLKNNIKVMKNNAGIKLTSLDSIQKYSDLYLECFNNCELYANWAFFDNVFKCISTSQIYLENLLKMKNSIYAFSFDIFQFIHNNPWTHSLKDKRVLFISPFEESIKEKIEIRKHIYGIDLFPGCEILTIKPPQTQGNENSKEFDIELDKFIKKLDNIQNNYDIALVSCGGYGTLVCNHIFKTGKSAIYVGGVLQMYWGILGQRWLRERPDIIRLYLNEYWTRPKENEKPKDYKNVEGSCYW